MSCGNKLKYTCGESKSNARCVFYDLKVPEYSKLTEESCRTVEETTDDLYKLISWVRESVDLGDNFNPNCLDVTKIKDSYDKGVTRYLIKDIIVALVNKVCSLEKSLSLTGGDSNSESKLISQLDLSCLGLDRCDNKPTNLVQLLQLMINTFCKKQDK